MVNSIEVRVVYCELCISDSVTWCQWERIFPLKTWTLFSLVLVNCSEGGSIMIKCGGVVCPAGLREVKPEEAN